MYRIAIPTLLLALTVSGNAEAAGLNLNALAVKFTGNAPVLGSLVTSKGAALPVLGELPSLNLTFGQRAFLLGNVNLADLFDAVDVGKSGTQFASVLAGQARKEIDLFKR